MKPIPLIQEMQNICLTKHKNNSMSFIVDSSIDVPPANLISSDSGLITLALVHTCLV